MNHPCVVQALSDFINQHVNDIVHHIDNYVVSSDDENDSNCASYETFYDDGGSQSTKAMTNFDSTQFLELWVMIEDYIANFVYVHIGPYWPIVLPGHRPIAHLHDAINRPA